MKKEMLFAVIIGLAVGLIITYGVFIARRSLRQSNLNNDNTASPTPSGDPTEVGTLILSSPEDEIVQLKKEIVVAGTTTANAYVVVFVNDNETITTADDLGNFSIATDLDLGGNLIVVHSLSEDGKETTVNRSIIYSTSSLTTASASAQVATKSGTVSPKPTVKASTKPSASPVASPRTSPSPRP